jgi:murein DD-endopeptidase MepM/ murein hydrolase activator NlpD
MTTAAPRDLAAPEPWERSLERSRRRRALLVHARRDLARRKGMSTAMATALLAGSGAPLALAGTAGAASQEVASASPANRAIQIKEGGLPLRLGSESELVAHVQRALEVPADGVFGAETDAAVRRYQYAAKLAVDGIVGPATWSALFGSGQAIGGDVSQGVKDALASTLRAAGTRVGADATAAQRGSGGHGDVAGADAYSLPDRQSAETGAGGPSGGSGTDVEDQPRDQPRATPQPETGTGAPRRLPGAQVGGDCSSASLSSPVRGAQSSPYGMRWGRMHEGVDIAAPSGTPIRAAACGTVSVRGQQSGYGNIVCITHTSTFATCYAHMSGFAVAGGQRVQTGQTIGYVGCTGSCTGPHLHFETRVNGRAQNPGHYLAGAAIPGRAAAAGRGKATATAAIGGKPRASSGAATAVWGTSSGGASAPGLAGTATSAGAPQPTQAAATTPAPVETAAPAQPPTEPAEAAAPIQSPTPVGDGHVAAPAEPAVPAPADHVSSAAPAPVAQAAPAPETTPAEAAPVATVEQATPTPPAPVEQAAPSVPAQPAAAPAASTQAAPVSPEPAPAEPAATPAEPTAPTPEQPAAPVAAEEPAAPAAGGTPAP